MVSIASAGAVPLGVLALCLSASVAALVVARALRLEAVLRRILLGRSHRDRLSVELGEIAGHYARGDFRAVRRVCDRCEWLLLRRGVEMVCDQLEPADIARRLEHISEVLVARRRRALIRAAHLASLVMIVPVVLVGGYATGLVGDRTGLEAWIAGLAFVTAIVLLLGASTARWMVDQLDAGRVARTLDVEALIFALSAMRGGAESDEVVGLVRCVLGEQASVRTPLRQAA